MKLFSGTLEELMPKDHFLRDLDRLVDFDFIYEKVENMYSKTGRPSIDHVILIKMLLIGYLYGIDSERKLEQEIQINIAYRRFLGSDLDERVPDHSTISQLRRRKFAGEKKQLYLTYIQKYKNQEIKWKTQKIRSGMNR